MIEERKKFAVNKELPKKIHLIWKEGYKIPCVTISGEFKKCF